MVRLAALIIAPALIAACQPAATEGETSTPEVSYEDAFIMAPIGGRDVTVGGVRITVTGSDLTLTGASSDAADSVETHTMSMEDGTMKMRPVESFEIQAGDTLVLDRGGDHLMLFGLDPDVSAGDTVSLSFDFETASGDTLTLDAEAEVRAQGE